MRNNYHVESLKNWQAFVEHYGPQVWTDPIQIADVLHDAARKVPSNHVYLPEGGGLDMIGSEPHGDAWISLLFDGVTVRTMTRPARLELVTFDEDPLKEWAYLYLESVPDPLRENPRGYAVEHQIGSRREYNARLRQLGVPPTRPPSPLWDGDSVVVSRYWVGSFLIIPKGCQFNGWPHGYAGMPSKRGPTYFKQYLKHWLLASLQEGNPNVTT